MTQPLATDENLQNLFSSELDPEDWRNMKLAERFDPLRKEHESNPYLSIILGRMLRHYKWVRPMPQDVVFLECNCCIATLDWNNTLQPIGHFYSPFRFERDLMELMKRAEISHADAEYLSGLPNLIDNRPRRNRNIKEAVKQMIEKGLI